MPGPLDNQRHERFAQGLAEGKTGDQAYIDAGFVPNRHNAARLRAKPHIQARVAELQAMAAEKLVITVDDIVRQLDEDRDFAKSCGSAAAMVTATMGKAKLLGLIIDKSEVRTSPLDEAKPDELDRLREELVAERTRRAGAGTGSQAGRTSH